MGDSSSLSIESVSRNSSASHLHLAAFWICLDGGEAFNAGEGVSCNVEEDGRGDPDSGGSAWGQQLRRLGLICTGFGDVSCWLVQRHPQVARSSGRR
jgi:hypothetical protein